MMKYLDYSDLVLLLKIPQTCCSDSGLLLDKKRLRLLRLRKKIRMMSSTATITASTHHHGRRKSISREIADENLVTLARLRFIAITVISTWVISFLLSVLVPPSTPVITLSDGKVQGRKWVSRDGREYWQFLSIPYAKPPLGELKFAPPVKVESWDGVKQVRSYPPFCIQFEAVVTHTVFGEEDCLYLNVFAPPIKEGAASKPVLVHVHGGGFLMGGSRVYGGGDYLVDEDMIVVTFNYRLGPYGFLNFQHDPSTDNVNLPRGNAGMKDQLEVLRWVKNNIASFGGDPNRVTIYGESAGSVSVHLHVLSPQSRGLFRRAISQSGSAFSSWGFTTKPREKAFDFAKQLGCPVGNNSALLDCLIAYDPKELVKFQKSVTDPSLLKDNLSPSVEKVLMEDTFLGDHPTDIITSGNFSRVPYMLGVNSGDGALRTGRFEALPHVTSQLQQNWTAMIGNVLLLDSLPHSVANRAREFYFGKNEKTSAKRFENTQSFLDTLTVMFSDIFAFEPVQRAAQGHARSGVPTYLYYYDYMPRFVPGTYSVFKAVQPGDWLLPEIKVFLEVCKDWVKEHLIGLKGAHQYGISHGEEMFQVWNMEGVTKLVSFRELEFSRNFVKMIGDFVHGSDHITFRGVSWPTIPVPQDNVTLSHGPALKQPTNPYMLLDRNGHGRVIPEPFSDRVNFWNSVGIEDFN